MTDLQEWIYKNSLKEHIVEILNTMKEQGSIEIDDDYDEDENPYIKAYLKLLDIKAQYEKDTGDKILDMKYDFCIACGLDWDECDL